MRIRFRATFLAIAIAVSMTGCGGALSPATRSVLPSTALRQSASARAASAYKLLYSFQGTPDGATPYSGLVAVNGTLYGTTLNGSRHYCASNCGQNLCYLGCGTVFSVTPLGTEQVVYNLRGHFNNAKDGSWPFSGLVSLNGLLYGTASSAGASSAGVVFSVSTSGTEHVLYSFAGETDGSGPEAKLSELNGALFGTTVFGGGTGCGGSGCGTVYRVTTTGAENVLYAFKGGTDGAKLYAGVTPLNGKLYGATLEGGGTGCSGNGCGTIFAVSQTGTEHVLYRFTGTSDGAFPNGLIAVNGVLYGTTEGGGSKSSGTFFSVTTSGVQKVLYNFQDIPDGNLPGANLIYSATAGEFYGTTVGGGTAGQGSVFSVSPTGSEQVLYSFNGGTDGSDPQGPVYEFNGHLFGTTATGGGTGCGGSGCGTIYRLLP